MFKVTESVKTTRLVNAGLNEDGPRVCDSGATGVVIGVDPREPDGIHVRLSNGIEWWFKPNQLEKENE